MNPVGSLRDARGAALRVVRWLLGLVFLWFGAHKVLHPVEFLKALREYDMLPTSPPQLLNLTVVVLPWIEIVCGLLLLLGAWLRATGALLLALTVVFTVAIAVRAFAAAGRLDVALCAVSFDCGCGQGVVFACNKLFENVGLIALCALVAATAPPLASGTGGGSVRRRRPRAGCGRVEDACLL